MRLFVIYVHQRRNGVTLSSYTCTATNFSLQCCYFPKYKSFYFASVCNNECTLCVMQYSVKLNCSKQKGLYKSVSNSKRNVMKWEKKRRKNPTEHFFRKYADKRFYLALNNFFVTHVTLHFFHLLSSRISLILLIQRALSLIVSIEFFFLDASEKSDKQAHFGAYFYSLLKLFSYYFLLMKNPSIGTDFLLFFIFLHILWHSILKRTLYTDAHVILFSTEKWFQNFNARISN